MFGNVRQAANHWIAEQRAILGDVQLLVRELDSQCGERLAELIAQLDTLNVSDLHEICRDHVFQKWLDEIRRAAIASYDEGAPLDATRVLAVTNLAGLATAMLKGEDFAFPLPNGSVVRELLPAVGICLAIPSTPTRDTLCRYSSSDRLVIVDSVAVTSRAYSRVSSIKIVSDNFEFFWDRSDEEPPISFDRNIDVSEWVDTLGRALRIVAFDDTAADLVKAFVSYLVPLKQRNEATNLSLSVRGLPTVIFKNNELTPYLVGETLVHEADHQFFYAVERFHQMWNAPTTAAAPIYFSPWRDDPRPLDGILRGASAFARVSQYYVSALSSGGFDDKEAREMGLLLTTRLLEACTAVETVVESGQLSDEGRTYVDEIRSVLNASHRATSEMGHLDRWRKRVEGDIAARREAFAGSQSIS